MDVTSKEYQQAAMERVLKTSRDMQAAMDKAHWHSQVLRAEKLAGLR